MTAMGPPPHHRRSRAGGFTLVEIMVAMTLGLLVLGVTVTLFAGTSRSRTDLERSNRLAENAQFARLRRKLATVQATRLKPL